MILGPLYKVDSKGKIRVLSIEVDGGRYRVISGLEDGAKITNKWTNTLPKNTGRANATTAEEQALKESQAKYDKKLREGYFKTKEGAHSSEFFRPQLANELEKKDVQDLLDKHGYLLMDPKLDGMRLICKPTSYKSRRGLDVPTAQWVYEDLIPFFKIYPNITLDGELYNHTYRDNFEDLMSLARRTKLTSEQKSNSRTLLQYHIYDMLNEDKPSMSAIARKVWLNLALTTGDRIKLVRYVKVTTIEEFEKAHQQNLLDGYEGSMIRVPTEPYKNGRSKFMLKYKDFKTAEFTIINILPGKGNRSDIAGSIIVNVDGISVGCGIRGSWEYAAELLKNKHNYINKDATIRFFSYTDEGSLRFPVLIDLDRWEYE